MLYQDWIKRTYSKGRAQQASYVCKRGCKHFVFDILSDVGHQRVVAPCSGNLRRFSDIKIVAFCNQTLDQIKSAFEQQVLTCCRILLTVVFGLPSGKGLRHSPKLTWHPLFARGIHVL